MEALKTLVVCLSTDLPKEADRDANFIYFVYNTLTLYMGKALYGENFCIVDTMPSSPDIDRLYICLDDGFVKVYDDYQVIPIGEVQTREMLNILAQAGTLYYFNSKERYIDKQNRLLVLPFNNGTYSLTVETPGDLLYNDNTIIKYDQDQGKFIIYGETYDEDPLDTKGFRGHETDTASIEVKDGRIEGNIKISKADGNLIRVVEDGLYMAVRNAVPLDEFDSWKTNYEDYKVLLDSYVASISEDLEKIQELISEDALNEKIKGFLQDVYPTIDEAIAKYDELNTQIHDALNSYEVYANTKFSEVESELNDRIDHAIAYPWGDLLITDVEYVTIVAAIKKFIGDS